MTVEGWKAIFDVVAVTLLFLTFGAGVGVLVTGNVINKRQEQHLHQFDKDLTDAKIALGQQQERAAQAERAAAEAKKATEAERLARLELEKLVSWRTISPEKREEIGLRLKEFKGVRIHIWHKCWRPRRICIRDPNRSGGLQSQLADRRIRSHSELRWISNRSQGHDNGRQDLDGRVRCACGGTQQIAHRREAVARN